MNRPNQIALALLLIPVLMHAQTSKPQPQTLYTFPLGIEAYTFRNSFPHDVAATLDTIKSLGFTEMEGSGGKIADTTFKRLCDERGISIPSIGVGYEQLAGSLDPLITRAKVMGAKYIMCAWIPHQGPLTLAVAQKAVIDFNRVGKVFADHGITFCYHFHGFEFQPHADGTLLDYIIRNTDPKFVSFEMDIFWIKFGGGDPVGLLRKYGNRWKLIHLKDMRKGTKQDMTGGTAPENDVALGSGVIDIPGVLRLAKRIGIKHYFIEDESNQVDIQLPQSIAYLKGLKE